MAHVYFLALPLHPSQRQIRAFLHLGQLKLSDNSPGVTCLPQALQLGISYEPAYISISLSAGIFLLVAAAAVVRLRLMGLNLEGVLHASIWQYF